MKTKKLLLAFAIIIMPAMLLAHAPKKVDLSYDQETGKLSITVEHNVKDVNDHYIELITISIDGEETKKVEYKVQSSLEKHEVVIDLPGVKKESEINVNAKCNKLGSKSASIKIE